MNNADDMPTRRPRWWRWCLAIVVVSLIVAAYLGWAITRFRFHGVVESFGMPLPGPDRLIAAVDNWYDRQYPYPAGIKMHGEVYRTRSTFFGLFGMSHMVAAVVLSALLMLKRRRARRRQRGLCTACGYDLQAAPSDRRCPECGEPVTASASNRKSPALGVPSALIFGFVMLPAMMVACPVLTLIGMDLDDAGSRGPIHEVIGRASAAAVGGIMNPLPSSYMMGWAIGVTLVAVTLFELVRRTCLLVICATKRIHAMRNTDADDATQAGS